jgi:3-oxoacyl-[acyl-carrier-protein] synthase-1
MRLFGDKVPPFSSTKANTGHLLGASGAVEAVFSVLSIVYGKKWPNLNFRKSMEETGLTPITGLVKGTEVRHVLTNSFGFGGNNTSLVFSAL